MARWIYQSAVFWLSAAQTGFTDCNHYFGSAAVQKKEINQDLQTNTDEFISSKGIFSSRKGGPLVLKVKAKQILHQLCAVFRSKRLTVQALKMNYDEL